MGYRKIINLLDNTPNQPSKFRARNWVEINDESWEMYDANNDLKSRTSIIRLCNIIIIYNNDVYVII